MPGTAKVEVRVGWTSLVGVEFRFDPPSPQWPASRVSKNPKIEKSPCVIVAIATDDHNAATIATVVTNRLRHRAPPNPKFPFCISTPKPVGTLVVSLNPSAKSDEPRTILPRPLVSYERGLATIPLRTLSRRWHAPVTSLKHYVRRHVIILFLPSP